MLITVAQHTYIDYLNYGRAVFQFSKLDITQYIAN